MNWQVLFQALAGDGAGFSERERRQVRLVAAAILLVFLYGCWCLLAWIFAPPAPIAVSGTVAFQGQPVEMGEVEFSPLAEGAVQRHTTKIEKGAFALPAKQGLKRNQRYAVKVSGYKKTGKLYKNAPGGPASEEYEQFVPARYNSATELSLETTRQGLASGLKLDLR